MHAYDGVVGPVFLLVPLLAWRSKLPPAPLRLLLLFSAFFLGYWTLTTQQIRFLLSLLPGLAVLLGFGLQALGSRSLKAVVWLLVAVNLAVGVTHVLKLEPLPYWSGRESRESYLLRRVPTYEIYRAVSKILPPHGKVYMVCSFNLFYLFDSPVRSDYVFEDYRFSRAVGAAKKPADILEFLKAQNCSHLLLNETILTHREAGLPLAEQRKLGEFLRLMTRPVYQHRGFRLYEVNYGRVTKAVGPGGVRK